MFYFLFIMKSYTEYTQKTRKTKKNPNHIKADIPANTSNCYKINNITFHFSIKYIYCLCCTNPYMLLNHA